MIEDKIILEGYNKHIINCIHYKNEFKKIAVLFPGLGYSTEAPFFYYLLNILFDKKYDVFSVIQRFNEWENYKTLIDKKECINYEGNKIFDYIIKLNNYEKYLWIGKSLGTASIQSFYNTIREKNNNKCIFCTPFSNHYELVKTLINTNIQNLIIWGTNDKFFNKQSIAEYNNNPNIKTLILENIDHGLCSNKGINDTLENMNIIMNCCIGFIQNCKNNKILRDYST